MFEVTVNQEKQKYRSKPTMDVDISGSSASIPKPLTYDYMPEGYPSKSVVTVTLMEEQEVAFADNGGGSMTANSPVNLDIKLGDELTVIWDGVSYDVIVTIVQDTPTFGDLSMIGSGATTDYPFLYVGQGPFSSPMFATADTAASHTIKVIATKVSYEKIDSKFLPVADETTSGVCSLSQILSAVGKKYHYTHDYSVTTTEALKSVIAEVNNRYSNISVLINNKFNGQILAGETGSIAGRSGANIIIADNIPDNSMVAYSSVNDNLEKVWEISKYGVIINSSTTGSTKKFKITVDDSGTISATEVT